MESTVILTIITIIAVFAVISYIKKIKYKKCCSGDKGSYIEKVKVKDKNKNNYQYKKILKIGGMTCPNCAKIIENNFNRLGDVYSKVNYDKEEAIILSKKEFDNKIFENVIKESGYRYYIKN